MTKPEEAGIIYSHGDLEGWDVSALRNVPLQAADAMLLVSATTKDAYSAEQFRIIRTRVVQALKRPFVLAVSSPSVGDGKSFTALNLAAAMALSGQAPTLLIDADLRSSALHRRLSVQRSPGLAEILSGASLVRDAIFRFEELPSLAVLPAGEETKNPTDLFDSLRWRRLAQVVRRHFGQVVVDCPPVNLFADYDLIEGQCDGVVAVVRPDHTDRTLCLAALAKMRPKLAGVVVNAAEEWFLWKKSPERYYSHYGSEERLRSGK
ncbi:MAG: CpsD/CapB family tyrosine-protein kinase [Acidobacteria bacterium]|nr:CpsD/CapB family tyrosine-protein kinase [Acidobacteriota bacterium]